MNTKQKKGKIEVKKAEEKTGKKTALNPTGAIVHPSGHISLAGRSAAIAKLVKQGITDVNEVIKRIRVQKRQS